MKQFLIVLSAFLLTLNLIANEDYMSNALGDVPGSKDYKSENTLDNSNYYNRTEKHPEAQYNESNIPVQQYNQNQQQNRYHQQNAKGPFQKVDLYNNGQPLTNNQQSLNYKTQIAQPQNTYRSPSRKINPPTYPNQSNRQEPNYMHYSAEQLKEKAKSDKMERGLINQLDRQ